MSKRRRPLTPEERAERAARAAQLAQRAHEVMSGAEIGQRVRSLLGMSRRIMSYSLRNQVLLLEQAAERGIELSDVDTFRGWCARGRRVRKGERALLIVRPVGVDDDQDDAESIEQEHQHESDTTDAPKRPRFRMMPVFAMSQTDPVEDAEETEPDEDGDDLDQPPAVFLWGTLIEQVATAGYTITRDGTAATTDHGARVVTIPGQEIDDDAVTTLGEQLAAILTHPTDRDKATAEGNTEQQETTDSQGRQRVTLPLGDAYGTATATVHTNWETGRTTYTVRGPRIRGTYTVFPDEYDDDNPNPTRVTVRYGVWKPRALPREYDDLPEINNVRFAGGTAGLDPSEVDDLTRWRLNGPHQEKTAERNAAVVRAILRHWFTRPDRDAVRTAAARYEAPRKLRYTKDKTQRLRDQITELTRQLAERENLAAELTSLTQATTGADDSAGITTTL
ncbi:hypothetical protein GCM10012275_61560 [Longimycelium tulufanense]|uniref:N-terminal domain-containing protein n=1 Tax=Longimycelium tulufanense TaxID=907463 RepID=A0A8J3CL06_9PSEU|nr:ArdC family protein [Longimycelium tulufanense]GGM82664.1 hypothetical protein GCM10012275_61560 [Longimycelium tulufanense]